MPNIGSLSLPQPGASVKPASRLSLTDLARAKGLPVEHLEALGLKNLPDGGIAIPYYGVTGEDIAVKRRTALKAKDGSFWPKGMSLAPYGLWKLSEASKARFVILVEGESDCWALWYHGQPVLGLPGASTAKTLAREYVESVETVYIHREPDHGGTTFVKAVTEQLAAIGFTGRVCELCMPPGIKDPADLHCQAPDSFNERFQAAVSASVLIDLSPTHQKDTEPAAPKDRKETKATRLVRYAQEALELWHTRDSVAYASTINLPRHTWPLRSKSGRQYLSKLFYEREAESLNTDALLTAIGTLEGIAIHDGPERPVFVRLAEWQGRIYLYLGDDARRVVVIGPDGWEIVDKCPVFFRHPRGMLPLPVPVKGGTIVLLRPFANLATENAWRLLVAWILAAVRPCGPFPVLLLHGEQGSAKSTLARLIRALLDPNEADLRSEPRDPRDLIIAASNGWIVAWDNLSYLPTWLSDCVCRLSMGGGFSTRELYSDDEERIFSAKRPVIMAAIEELATRSDLLDRGLSITLPRIRGSKRRTEKELWSEFEAARPRILGALLDVASAGLRNLPKVKLERLPRMADFLVWVTACEPALGWEPGSFLKAYRASIKGANELALDTSVITAPLRQLMGEREKWSGTASDLLNVLTLIVGEQIAKSREWPKKAHVLSGKLRRIAPNLRKTGIEVEFSHDGTQRIVTLTRKNRRPSVRSVKTVRDTEKHGTSPNASGNNGSVSRIAGALEKTPENTGNNAANAPNARSANLSSRSTNDEKSKSFDFSASLKAHANGATDYGR